MMVHQADSPGNTPLPLGSYGVERKAGAWRPYIDDKGRGRIVKRRTSPLLWCNHGAGGYERTSHVQIHLCKQDTEHDRSRPRACKAMRRQRTG